MSPFDPATVAGATGGRWLRRPARALTGVGIDSRCSLENRAFVAIRGERRDGHEFLAEAAAGGAAAVVIERRDAVPALPSHVGVLLVGDTRRALIDLARAHRRALGRLAVIAVTGSCGKTTVKMLIGAVLATTRRGTCAPHSFNNGIGVPLTILGAAEGDEYLVIEIGTNQPGEIEALGALAAPDVGVITMSGRAHLEGLGSPEAVAREKASLLEQLRPGHLAVVNADCPLLRPYLGAAESLVTFGESPDADLRLSGWGERGGTWWLEVNGRDRFVLGLPGRHNAINALAAIAAGRAMAVPEDRIAEALRATAPMESRMRRLHIGRVRVYDDSYNANPDSMRASLETFALLARDCAMRVLVLGDMRELGEHALRLHEELGRDILALDAAAPVGRLVLVGELAAAAAGPVCAAWGPGRVVCVPQLTPAAASDVARLIEPGAAVLLKGSRAMALERLVGALQDRFAAVEPATGTRPDDPSLRAAAAAAGA